MSTTASTPDEPGVRISRSDGIIVVELHNPARRNAVDDSMIAELGTVLEHLDDVDVVVLKGTGTKAFCAGFDLSSVGAPTEAKTVERASTLDNVFRTIEAADVVVIAALNGDALGVGLELASACDLRIAREGARFGLPAIKIGVEYHESGARRIARAFGIGRMQQLLHTGELLSTDAAYVCGFVSMVVPAPLFDASIHATAERLAAVPRELQRYNKRLLRSL